MAVEAPALEVTTVADDEAVLFDGADCTRVDPLEPDAVYTVMGETFRTLPRPPGQRLATIPGSVPDPANRPPGCPFQPRCPVSLPVCERPPPWVPLGEKRHVRCVHYGEDQEPA